MRENSRSFNSVYLAIGKIVANWCIVEHELHRCAVVIQQCCNGRLAASDIPISLTNKLRLLKRALRTEATLGPLVEDGGKLISRISMLKEYRHLATHGVITNLNTKTTVVSFLRYEPGGKSLTVKRTRIKLSRLNEKAREIAELCFEIGFFSAQFKRALRSSK